MYTRRAYLRFQVPMDKPFLVHDFEAIKQLYRYNLYTILLHIFFRAIRTPGLPLSLNTPILVTPL
jgi:hypothetical protein